MIGEYLTMKSEETIENNGIKGVFYAFLAGCWDGAAMSMILIIFALVIESVRRKIFEN